MSEATEGATKRTTMSSALRGSSLWEQPAGLSTEKDSSLYVSRGTGFRGPPVRVAAPPELVKVTLGA